MTQEITTLPTSDNQDLFKIPSIFDKLKDIKFTRVDDEKSNLLYEHIEYIPILYTDDKELSLSKSDEIKKYINELAEKLLDESKNIFDDIDALPTFIGNVNSHSSSIIDKVTSGNEQYLPFINVLEEDGKTISPKTIILAIKIGITKTTKVLNHPMLIWVVSSHTWEQNADDSGTVNFTETLELFSE